MQDKSEDTSMTDLLVIMDSCERASKEELEKIFTKVSQASNRPSFNQPIPVSMPRWSGTGSSS